MFSVLQCFVSVKIQLISVVVIVLMTTSVDSQSKDPICDYIIKKGRVRDLGLYQFIDSNGFSYRLFSREWDGFKEDGEPVAEEYQLEIINGKVTAHPLAVYQRHGLHKFYGGYARWHLLPTILSKAPNNCWLQKEVCLRENYSVLMFFRGKIIINFDFS